MKSVWIWLENVSMDFLVVTVFIFHFFSLFLFLSYMVNFQPDQMINFWSIKMMKWMVEWLKTYYCLKCLHHQYCCCCCCWKTKSKSMLTTATLKFQKIKQNKKAENNCRISYKKKNYRPVLKLSFQHQHQFHCHYYYYQILETNHQLWKTKQTFQTQTHRIWLLNSGHTHTRLFQSKECLEEHGNVVIQFFL